jgi:hypothetical protein
VGGGSPTQPGQRASAAAGTAAVAIANVTAAIEALRVFVIRVSTSVSLMRHNPRRFRHFGATLQKAFSPGVSLDSRG